MKKAFGVLTALALCLMCASAMAHTALVPAAHGGVAEVHSTLIDGEEWLFLPSFAELSSLYPDAAETEEEGVWYDENAGLFIMQSGNVRTLFFFSANPQEQGREWIEADLDHLRETTGSMALISPNGQVEHVDDVRQLRGRGNYTWGQEKKGYQLKLENVADLLKTGKPENRSRTWILLGEAFDGTLLRNRIAQDLALELGMEASESEFVDFYYDGEYRGLYLLSEKVEVGSGRVSGMDFDELLERWNNKIGLKELDVLPTAQGENAYGLPFSYVENVADNGAVSAGTYLLEWENKGTPEDRSFFALENGTYCAVKNPKHASENMMHFISERFLQARQTLLNGGVHPQNGQRLEEAFDLESMARAILLNELTYNCDGFHFSSTYFVLPENAVQFKAGPVWDFDLAFRYRADRTNEAAAGFKDAEGWMPEFYRCSAFLQAAKRIYLEQIDPLISDVLLGNEQGVFLRSYDAYVEAMAEASRMNARRWPVAKDGRFVYGETLEAEIELLRKFIRERSAWLRQAMEDLQSGQQHLALWLDVRCGHPETGIRILSAPWQAAEVVSISAEQLTEADEENFALWQMEAVLALPEGMAQPTLSLNGTPLAYEQLEDGSIRICITFEDPSYRPVDYYGEDIGLVYQYESYVARYPEIAEMCEYDPQTVMDYFCDEGIYEGQIGNAYFDPAQALEMNSWLYHTLGEDWPSYYWDYISYGYEEGWMQNTPERFVPQVSDAL